MNDLERINSFFSQNHVAAICSVRDGAPWAANCNYAFDANGMALLVMTSLETRHGGEWNDNPPVAGTICDQETDMSKIKGIQYTGSVSKVPDADEAAKAIYVEHFPHAAQHSAQLWRIELETVKLTDNSEGFGTHFSWQRDAAE